ncbi:MAG TPA: chromosomal replication initiator protein DnaA [Acidimicrobiales bacterium]|nr:chromosomal replication initiator protein DnaA [Acidimicrobiales bacterium]
MDDQRHGRAEEQVDETSGLWTRCTASLREQVSETTWQMWLSGIEPVSFGDGRLVLGVPNLVVRDRVQSRFLPLIEETLAVMAGAPVQVDLQIADRAAGFDAVPGPSGNGGPGTVPAVATGPGTAVPTITGPVSAGPASAGPATTGTKRAGAGGGRDTATVSLDARFTFDTYVTASSNRLAHAAAQAVAETPGRSYNPLFIYGDSGLGKTHLLHAIGNYVQENFPSRTVLYVTTETFMNDFVDSLRMSTTIAFKRRYRECDVLLIDDVQFMENKEGLQEEFFHTYNDLHGAGKQIVLTSDRPPKSIETLEDRLRSRFLSGLITEVDPPDLETRLAILRSKAEADHDDIPDDVLEFIATHVKNNIRELEGALIRVTAFASLSREPISLDLAERVLSDIVSAGEPRRITPQMILDATAAAYGFSVDAICGPSRTRPLVTARQVAMYLVRNLTDYSYPAIARVFGGRDHTTVIHAVDKITTQMKERRQLYEQVTELILQIRNGA